MSDCLKGSALQLITRKTLRKTALKPAIMQRWCETHLIGSAYIATTCNYYIKIYIYVSLYIYTNSIRIHLRTSGHPLRHSASCVRMRYGRMLNADPGKVSSRAKKWGAQRGEKHHPASTTFGGYIVIQQQGGWIISKNGMGITVCLSIW